MTITAPRTSRTHQQYAAIDREFGLALEGLPEDATPSTSSARPSGHWSWPA